MAGPANSWVSQYVNQPVPCTTPATQSTLTNCVFWLIAGLLIGSLRFTKKGQQS